MTIRDLIKAGVDIDEEINVEAEVLNDEGEYTGTYYSYSDNMKLKKYDDGTTTIFASLTPV